MGRMEFDHVEATAFRHFCGGNKLVADLGHLVAGDLGRYRIVG